MKNSSMNEILLLALRKKYEGDVALARANIETYLRHSVGIGEHSDITGAIDEEVAKLAEADEKLETLNKYF
jgi:hypothetical protein